MAKLLEPRPTVAEGFYSSDFELRDSSGVFRSVATIGEHPTDGRLTLSLNDCHADRKEWKCITLSASQTEHLRQLLNRAHRERQR